MTVNYWTVACVRLMHSLRLPIYYAFMFLSRRHHIKLAMIISFQSIILQHALTRLTLGMTVGPWSGSAKHPTNFWIQIICKL